MTVKELLNHFNSFYFDKIVIFDKTNNVQDTAYIYAMNNPKKTIKNMDEFLKKYGDYEVTDWEVDVDGSSITKTYISIDIEEE